MQTIDEIHRVNLRLLRDELGGVAKLADQIDKSPSQVSQWLNASLNSATRKPRGMNYETCRHIERACGKAPGWMDSAHGSGEKLQEEQLIKVQLMRLIDLFYDSTPHGRERILATAETEEKRGQPAVRVLDL